MAAWTWPIASGERAEITPRVRVARYGDGYEQRIADGINTMPRRWNIRLAASTATVNAADAFLRERKGVEAFDWVALDGTGGTWVCRSWTVAYFSGDGAELTGVFEEVFE